MGLFTATFFGCQRDFMNPSDPHADRFTETSRASLRKLDITPSVQGDTVRLYAAPTSQPVLDDGLVIQYAWDWNGDGTVDTLLRSDDTLALPLTEAGMKVVRVFLTDKAGFQDSAELRFMVGPSFDVQLSLPKYDQNCPAYAQEPLLMRLPLVLSHFTVEKTKVEGLENSEFAVKLAQTLVGRANPIGLLDGFEYGFSRGIYRFRQKELQFEVAFHYGPGVPNHVEGDTILENLFDLDSYFTVHAIEAFPPSVDYSRGPLSYLIDADFSVDWSDALHPKFDFQVDFNRVRISMSRATRSLLVLSNQNLTLANALFFALYEGQARLAPVYPGTLVAQFSKDSLALDFSGTRVSSPDLPIEWAYTVDDVSDSGVYHLSLVQEYTGHQLYAGNASGVNKVFGQYEAINTLGSRDFKSEIRFDGRYSSQESDSARFYCREPLDSLSLFGMAAFESEIPDQAFFQSKRYGYAFHFPFPIVEPWSGSMDSLPISLRDL